MALVPVLLYHSISSRPHPLIAPYATTPEAFAEQLDLIVERGLEAVTISGLAERLDRKDHERLVAVTFDDGFADIATAALPALRERALPATLFVTTGVLPGAQPLDAELAAHMLDHGQLSELRAHGVEIGAHSHSHPQLDTLTERRLRDELTRPKAILEDALQAPVDTFAYPHGYSGPRVRRATAAAGYRVACGVGNTFTAPEDDRFAIKRLMLGAHHTSADVAAWLDGEGAGPPPRHEPLPTRGWRAYRRARSLLTRRPGADAGWPAARLPR
jgi:peptidoglycan/xylan/chitin deacetylase (PgdA/CDA1 family)